MERLVTTQGLYTTRSAAGCDAIYGYDDELFQDWRDGKIGEKDLPEEVMAMTLDLCERWRAEQERCRRVHAAQRLSRDPGPSRSRSRSRSPRAAAPELSPLFRVGL